MGSAIIAFPAMSNEGLAFVSKYRKQESKVGSYLFAGVMEGSKTSSFMRMMLWQLSDDPTC